MSRVLILIPPSEGKTPSGRLDPLTHLSKESQIIYDRLTAYKGDLAQLYGVKGKALEAAREANRTVLTSRALPAIERYSGVVYDGIDYPSLPPKGREFFNTHVRIVSALFGLLKADDPIPDYKLKIEKLDAARFWRPIITARLKGHFILDLLPQAHQKAVSYEQGIAVDFIVLKNNKPVPAGHQGKLIKGKFIRWLCIHQITDPKGFIRFTEDGFRFDGANFIKSS
jgi:uncharacterized protein